MKSLPLYFFLILFFFSSATFSQKLDWVKGISNTNGVVTNGYQIKVDTKKNIYLKGTIDYLTNFDLKGGQYMVNSSQRGSNNIFLAKWDSALNIQWVNVYEYRGFGYYDSYGYYGYYGSYGSYGSYGHYSFNFEIDNNENIYYVSTIDSTIKNITKNDTFHSKQKSDIFISKLNKNGKSMWHKVIGSKGYDFVSSSILNKKTNELYISGVIDDSLRLVTKDDNGVSLFIPQYENSAFITKVDSAGNFIWFNKYDCKDYHGVFSLAIDANSNVLASGFLKDSLDLDLSSNLALYTIERVYPLQHFVLKLNKTGHYIWSKGFPSSEKTIDHYHYYSTIHTDSKNNVYYSPYLYGNVDVDPGNNTELRLTDNDDLLVIKLDSNGIYQWDNQIKKVNYYFDDKSLIIQDKVYITSNFRDSLKYVKGADSITLRSTNLYNPYMVIFSLDGKLESAFKLKTDDRAYNGDLALDKDNNIYWTGQIHNDCDFDPTIKSRILPVYLHNGTAFIAKYSSTLIPMDSMEKDPIIDSIPTSLISNIHSTDQLSFSHNNVLFSSQNIHRHMKLSLYTIAGNMIMQNEMKNTNEINLKTDAIPLGIYIVCIELDNETKNYKILKE